MFFCQPKWTSFYHIYIVTAWILQNLESRDWHTKLKHFLTCIVCIKNALFDDNVNALTSLPASSLASSYITRQSVSQPHASMPKQRLICMLFFPLHSSCVYDREVHRTIRCACMVYFLNFSCMFLNPTYFSNLNCICSNLLDLKLPGIS